MKKNSKIIKTKITMKLITIFFTILNKILIIKYKIKKFLITETFIFIYEIMIKYIKLYLRNNKFFFFSISVFNNLNSIFYTLIDIINIFIFKILRFF